MARITKEISDDELDEITGVKLPAEEEQDDEPVRTQLDQSPQWERAFNRAIKQGCSEKAATLYADAHHEDDEFTD